MKIAPIPLQNLEKPSARRKKKAAPKPSHLKVKIAGPPAKVQEMLGGFKEKR